VIFRNKNLDSEAQLMQIADPLNLLRPAFGAGERWLQ
jgi:hypothetical protein